LVDLQLGLVAAVRHAVLLALVQLSTLSVPANVGLGLAKVNVTGQGRSRLCRDLRVLQWRHDLRFLATYTATASFSTVARSTVTKSTTKTLLRT